MRKHFFIAAATGSGTAPFWRYVPPAKAAGASLKALLVRDVQVSLRNWDGSGKAVFWFAVSVGIPARWTGRDVPLTGPGTLAAIFAFGETDRLVFHQFANFEPETASLNRRVDIFPPYSALPVLVPADRVALWHLRQAGNTSEWYGHIDFELVDVPSPSEWEALLRNAPQIAV